MTLSATAISLSRAITGFPPGIVQPPGTVEAGTPVAQQAQADLTAAYLNAAGRPINATTTADLSGLTLVGGVYEGPSQGALSLTGTLTLDGEGDPNSVFIFQTDSTLITGSGSVVSLINGAQECNVFWQVGSSATLGTGSTFVGNILALTSISVTTNVTVHGRALAQTGAVTLDDDTFTQPLCDLSTPTTTTTASGATTSTSGGGGGTGTTAPLTELPRTGSSTGTVLIVAVIALTLGAGALRLSRAPKR
ncbi:MAG: ice-binding family protein [Acidimicrobiia bacterium]